VNAGRLRLSLRPEKGLGIVPAICNLRLSPIVGPRIISFVPGSFFNGIIYEKLW